MQENFPADFVAEGLDQTRGWFYTLMVLSTALFDKPAFKNLVCNGLVLAEDGKKMSKRLSNYPVGSLGPRALGLFNPLIPLHLLIAWAQGSRREYGGLGATLNKTYMKPPPLAMQDLRKIILSCCRAARVAGELLVHKMINPPSLKPFYAAQDPRKIIDSYGADALRLYLINSPVVRAEPLRFREDGVFAVVKDVFLPWYNAYRFLVQNTLRLQAESGAAFRPTEVRTIVSPSKP